MGCSRQRGQRRAQEPYEKGHQHGLRCLGKFHVTSEHSIERGACWPEFETLLRAQARAEIIEVISKREMYGNAR